MQLRMCKRFLAKVYHMPATFKHTRYLVPKENGVGPETQPLPRVL